MGARSTSSGLVVNLELAEEEFKVRVDQVAKAMGTRRSDLFEKIDFLNLKRYATDLKVKNRSGPG
jgi:hypothetical protein